MPTCVFLSMDSLGSYVSDDTLVIPHLAAMGWKTEILSWRRSHIWTDYDKVVVRSTWDYQEAAQDFLRTLQTIQASGTPLHNSSELIAWNLQKSYLLELLEKGIPIVPSLFKDSWEFMDYFSHFQTPEIIIKPQISASAQDTFRISQSDFAAFLPQLSTLFAHRPYMVQPFRESIIEEGEYSLLYFGEIYSHAILKRPKPADFRVQEEHGGQIRPVDPPEELRARCGNILHILLELPLYARFDFVRNPSGSFEVMEVELIEPSMYLRYDKEAPRRFAEAIVHS